MKELLNEFKAFAIKGNVMDLAVAVVIGGAFGKIVTSLVNDIIMPIVGIVLGGIDFTMLAVTIGDVALTYGNFIQSIVDFMIIALCIFLAIKMITTFNKKEHDDIVASVSREEELLEEIRDLLKNK